MPEEKRAPLRFWIGLHRDGSGRQCIVDFHGDTMEGVKQAWNERNANRVTTFETVIIPDLPRGDVAYLELMQKMERLLGNSSMPALEMFLRAVAMSCYEAGLQQGALKRGKP